MRYVFSTLVLIAGLSLFLYSRSAGLPTAGFQAAGSEVSGLERAAERHTPPADVEEDPFGVGRIEPVSINTNPHTRSVGEAFTTGQYPERQTVMVQPQPFDRVAFEANPEDYLETVEPGRVYQTAQPADGVPELKVVDGNYHEVVQGDSVMLTVRTAPNGPVTFTSFDLGAFSNKLPSITVQADADGIASAEFFGTPGTMGEVNILAGSPRAWGQAKFLVVVAPSASDGPPVPGANREDRP